MGIFPSRLEPISALVSLVSMAVVWELVRNAFNLVADTSSGTVTSTLVVVEFSGNARFPGSIGNAPSSPSFAAGRRTGRFWLEKSSSPNFSWLAVNSIVNP